jgi:hypothetical protein
MVAAYPPRRRGQQKKDTWCLFYKEKRLGSIKNGDFYVKKTPGVFSGITFCGCVASGLGVG